MRHWCRYDYECPGIEKCCSHGYGGYGQKFFCTIPEKPGRCPYVTGPGICIDQCSNDFDCPYGLKCCFNGCGTVCTHPGYGKTY
ncbi:hypothetical protein FSP39_008323 [Pinctada imbricata]|uniref:WAP domain-containing protein n=1 Tax=Pinctada imbricata TaxID=66713 RepID=A0AA88YIE7_PINIB|nr:hypothetical protein FSP39_008323 [Pinctada imbricata]